MLGGMKTSWPDLIFFAVVAGMALAAAVRVVLSRNPVHSALMLALTLFAVALVFIAQSAPFLAAVQMIVYAGAVVVLFLFVIMLLGVDKLDDLREKLPGQRVGALVTAALFVAAIFAAIRLYGDGVASEVGGAALDVGNVEAIASTLFSTYLYAFELTVAPILVAVIASVVLAKRNGKQIDSTRAPDNRGDIA